MGVLRDDLDRRIVRLAIPALGTLAVEPLYVLVDTAIVGRISTDALAGLAIAGTVLLTLVSLASFLEYGVTPDIAFAHGSGRAHDARRAATDALTLAVILGTVVGAAVALAARPLCWVLGGRGVVLENAVLYLRISAVGLPFVLIALVGHGVMRGINDLRKPLIIVVVANAVNVVLEIVAVYWLDLGIAGSAWSTVIVQGAAAAVVRRHPAAAHRPMCRPSWVALPTGADRRRPPRRALAGDVRGVELVHVRRRAHRHADAGGQPGARPAVQRARPHTGRAGHPGAVAGRRRARHRPTSITRSASATPAPACRCGAAGCSPCCSQGPVRGCRASSPTILPCSRG